MANREPDTRLYVDQLHGDSGEQQCTVATACIGECSGSNPRGLSTRTRHQRFGTVCVVPRRRKDAHSKREVAKNHLDRDSHLYRPGQADKQEQ
jgi:hypothetical protein